jgi:hypothetical protein
MLVFFAVAVRRRVTAWGGVVAAHCAFFASFIGIHPEHYMWFLPLLIVFAWDAFKRKRFGAFAASIAITLLGYAYKVAYGLRGPVGNTSQGKQHFRELFERYVGIDLKWLQVLLALASLATLLTLMWQALSLEPEEFDAQVASG